jgi:cytochrome c-type biogenesis protein CcmH
MREIIKKKLAKGETTEQIIEYFVTEYGEVVLAAPTRQGFNLTVWILPFLGIIVGGGIITVVIIFWTRRRHQALVSEDTHESHADIPDKYKETFESELEDFE